MPIAGFQSVPKSEGEWARFAFDHMDHHFRLATAAFKTYGIVVPNYALNPFDPEHADSWLDQHQTMHEAIDSLLGFAPYNMMDVDFKDEKQAAGWVYLNFQNHYREAEILNVF
jgi:hypothetical protein